MSTDRADAAGDVDILTALRRRINQMDERVRDMEDEIGDLRGTAQQAEELALTAFKSIADLQNAQEETKVDVAKRLARDELLRRVAMQAGTSQIPVSRSRVRELAKPAHELRHQTIKDAFGDLAAEYECFYETTSQGHKSLSVTQSQIPEELVIQSVANTGREDIAEALLGMDSADLVADALAKSSISDTAETEVPS